MDQRLQRLYYWTPRILGILFTIFISLFALDVFREGYRFDELLIALFMHLIPTYLLAIVLAIAWRWEFAGGLLFLALGTSFFFHYNNQSNWITHLIIAGPPLLVGMLFLISRFSRMKTYPTL